MEFNGGRVGALTLNRFKEELYDNPSAILLYFWESGSDPCLKMKKVVEEATLLLEGEVRFAHVDVHAEPAIAKLMWIDRTPCFVLMQDRDVVDAFCGVRSTEALVAEVLTVLCKDSSK